MKQLLASLTVCLLTCAAAVADDRVSFNHEVRPILSENCFYCHGPDAAHRQADLRLDLRDDAIAAKAFVPGKPDDSRIIERISSAADELMPPPTSNKSLTAREKEILRRWIAEGAEYEGHWALVAPQSPPIPKVEPLLI
ncbi:MAG: hypothetical protein K8U03_14500 [Planctomycetia bacterium]|nr:hypothetical protein [Planctomycetia bacterium]